MDISKITTPTLLLDKTTCINNIKQMAEKAKINNVIFRPHFKTHQSLPIAKWFKKFGVKKIAVSSLQMADYFVHDNWKDITLAFPVNIREIDHLNELSEEIQLNITVENNESVKFLKENLKYPVGFFIKIDTGYNRTGIISDNLDLIDQILNETKNSELLNFAGFLTHAGHTYHAKSKKEINHIFNTSIEQLNVLKQRYKNTYPELILSYGDTPSCSLVGDFMGINEIRPGNFVFYDYMQFKLGSCDFDQIAVCMACPVVAIHKERNEIIIHGGAVHFSKEFIENSENKIFGQIVLLDKNGWHKADNNAYLTKLSQEHGTIKATQDFINTIKIGDLIGVIPVHSCLTANLMKGYLTTDNEWIDHFSGSK
ncbi:MAG: alanine racemase [Bacteroidetes bacterium GWF2_33_16]|nr:MAG: alanine racemase [Bacteroidetes bacterium GWE2_32_14]OFY06491.1 MAG: alanine racemase [Bacteroidetes bacterium GWF2_33_16]